MPDDQKRGPGRPPKPDEEKRTESHGVFFTPAEMEEVREKADEAGLAVSAYLRKAALGKEIELRSRADQQTRRELRAIGKNLNQLTRMGHLGDHVGQEVESALSELQKALKDLR